MLDVTMAPMTDDGTKAAGEASEPETTTFDTGPQTPESPLAWSETDASEPDEFPTYWATTVPAEHPKSDDVFTHGQPYPWVQPQPLGLWRDPRVAAALIVLIAAVLVSAVVGVNMFIRRDNSESSAHPGALPSSSAASTQATTSAETTTTAEATSSSPPSSSPTSTTQPTVSTASAPPLRGRRITNDAGFSFVMPAGWVESDSSKLDYGSELLSKVVGEPSPGEAPPVANDARIVMGRLDNRLYANSESDNTEAAKRLASDMGEFFMPYPGTRVDQKIVPVDGGAAVYYTVRFKDSSKPNGQLMAAVVSRGGARWFSLWLGTGNDPVDQTRAIGLANSIEA